MDPSIVVEWVKRNNSNQPLGSFGNRLLMGLNPEQMGQLSSALARGEFEKADDIYLSIRDQLPMNGSPAKRVLEVIKPAFENCDRYKEIEREVLKYWQESGRNFEATTRRLSPHVQKGNIWAIDIVLCITIPSIKKNTHERGTKRNISEISGDSLEGERNQ